MTSTPSHPTTSTERIQALDFLRGFALLGILIMNIQSFAMPSAYLNPSNYGDLTGANKLVWILSHLFADQKFMTIFSLLFGAGIILMTERAEARTGKSAGLHYKRTFWLLMIGLIHAHIIWNGDILFSYAMCGFFVYLFRKKNPKTLLILGLLMISVHSIFYSLMGSSMAYWPAEAVEQAKVSWEKSPAQIQEEISLITGTLGEQIGHNSTTALFMETLVFFMIFLWRAGGLMLVGMALYKWGVFTAKRSAGFYKKGLLIGWLIGFPLAAYGVYRNFAADWSFEFSMYLGSQYNYWASLGIAFGYICGIMLLAQSQAFPWLRDRLAAIGQMALTNYLAQSLICVFLFWGVGFGLYGELERTAQVLVVLAVWGVQIAWSRPWLDRFLFGPVEWLWRTLTYGKRQPLRR
ncbi:MAG: DUF418 domain-containing protein [Bacteroidota bacterium]